MKFQRGGFVMGLIVGLMVGLAVALGVALYVTKVPVPFVNKVPQRTAEQDAAEAEKNKNWDPNGPLYGKNPARPNMNPPTAASGVVTPAPATNPPVAVLPPPAPASTAVPSARTGTGTAVSRRDPAAILGDRPGAGTTTAAAPSTKSGPDPFSYFVQVGAYARPEDAEAQRAKLAMLGMTAKVTEREQAGRTVYRVRVGPFDHKDEADSTKDKLDASGMESSLVRVQR
ncbi:MAG TPA: SPOR domain-containing protein [Albitalea sp.]|nr:SPOR domain-containing protein [Albitalea sp.]